MTVAISFARLRQAKGGVRVTRLWRNSRLGFTPAVCSAPASERPSSNGMQRSANNDDLSGSTRNKDGWTDEDDDYNNDINNAF